MINRVVLVGRLTKEPVMRKTTDNKSVVSFTVACDRRLKTQDQTADFINCIAWNRLADLMAQYLHKGSLIGVEGRIQTRSYDDQSGKRVYVTEIVADSVQFLDTRNNSAPTQSNEPSYQAPQAHHDDYGVSTLDIASDDLPF